MYIYICTYICVYIYIYIYKYSNESRYAYEWVISHKQETRHTHEWVMDSFTCINKSCFVARIQKSHVWPRKRRADDRLSVSHIWMSDVTRIIESRHTSTWVTSHIWISHDTYKRHHNHVTHVDESCCITHIQEALHTHAWVMSHTWMCHVTHMNESCHTQEWVMLRHTYKTCRVTCVFSRRDSWRPIVCGTHMDASCHTCDWVAAHIYMSHVTHTHESCHIYKRLASPVTQMHASCRITHLLCAYVCVCVCVCMCACACVCVMHVCVYTLRVMQHVWSSEKKEK